MTSLSTVETGGIGLMRERSLLLWSEQAMSTPCGQFRKLSASRASNAACGVRTDGSISCWGDLYPVAPLNRVRYLQDPMP